MSKDYGFEYEHQRRQERRAGGELYDVAPLSAGAIEWLRAHHKEYRAETLARFEIQEGRFKSYRIDESCIVIPVRKIFRVYLFNRLKPERWKVVPPGYPAQWLTGNLRVGEAPLDWVILSEGEWDAFRLYDQGFRNVACHTAGAATWKAAWTRMFAGKKVFIAYDMDAAGLDGADRVAHNLFPVAEEVRIVRLPLRGTPDENDVSDYFRLGGDADGFRKLLGSARRYVPAIRFRGRRNSLSRDGLHA